MARTQQYEDYWKVTLEYTDINDDRFIDTLRLIKDFIDEHGGRSRKLYGNLQGRISERFPKKNATSVRKSINQFIKLGFVKPLLAGYNDTAVDFLNATTNKRRNSVFSRTVYNYSSFNSSVIKDKQGGHLKFLVRTLEEVGNLKSTDIGALMTLDINKYEKGYLNKDELHEIKQKMHNIDFLSRKYNQLGHFKNILSRLDRITFKHNSLYFTEDAERLHPPERERQGRDPYLQRLFKLDLENESLQKAGSVACMVERIAYPALIASHIKPFIRSEKSEAYDPENGLLLTRSMDALFDLGYISFENNGQIVLCDALSPSAKNYLAKLQLYNEFLTSNRSRYLSYHRKNILKG